MQSATGPVYSSLPKARKLVCAVQCPSRFCSFSSRSDRPEPPRHSQQGWDPSASVSPLATRDRHPHRAVRADRRGAVSGRDPSVCAATNLRPRAAARRSPSRSLSGQVQSPPPARGVRLHSAARRPVWSARPRPTGSRKSSRTVIMRKSVPFAAVAVSRPDEEEPVPQTVHQGRRSRTPGGLSALVAAGGSGLTPWRLWVSWPPVGATLSPYIARQAR